MSQDCVSFLGNTTPSERDATKRFEVRAELGKELPNINPYTDDPIQLSFGASYSDDSYQQVLSLGEEGFNDDYEEFSDDYAGLNLPRKTHPGSFKQADIFAQIEMPLVRNHNLIGDLTFNAAYRYSDRFDNAEYPSLEGRFVRFQPEFQPQNTQMYMLDLDWAIKDSINLFVSRSHSARWSSFNEAYLDLDSDFYSGFLLHPCLSDGSAPRATLQQCQNAPGANFSLTIYGIQNLYLFAPEFSVYKYGNVNLPAEEHKSTQLGLLYNFTKQADDVITVLFVRTEIDKIPTFSNAQHTVDGCFLHSIRDYCLAMPGNFVGGPIAVNSSFTTGYLPVASDMQHAVDISITKNFLDVFDGVFSFSYGANFLIEEDIEGENHRKFKFTRTIITPFKLTN